MKIAFPNSIALFATFLFLTPLPAFPEASPIDAWKSIIDKGEMLERKGERIKAIDEFSAAASLADRKKLPTKYTETAICRGAAVSVRAGKINQADASEQRLMKLIANEKPPMDLQVWVIDLADAYQAQSNPEYRLSSLEKAYALKALVYRITRPESRDWIVCANLLSQCYGEHGQSARAAEILRTVAAAQRMVGQNISHPVTQVKRFIETVNQKTIDFKAARKYDEARRAATETLKAIKPNSSDREVKLIAVYSFLGMNALADSKASESDGYFAQAKSVCAKLGRQQDKQTKAGLALNSLISVAQSDFDQNRLDLAEKELKRLLDVQEKLTVDERGQYMILRTLSEVLRSEQKHDEAVKCLENAISIASLPNSYVAQDVPDLLLIMGLTRVNQGRVPDMNKAFERAMKAEADKSGFHATKVLVYWGCMALEKKEFALALEKLSLAQKQAQNIPRKERGTLLVDSFLGLLLVDQHYGNKEAERLIWLKLPEELRFQKELNSNLGPNFWHKL